MTTNKRTRPVYEGSSFKRTYTFYDETGTIIDAADITSLTWLVEVTDSQEIASGTVDPPTNPYTLNITPTINTLTGSREEKRKIILEWTFNNGEGGDVDVYYYTLKPV